MQEYKQLGTNVTSVDEYSQSSSEVIGSARIMHIMHIVLRIMHISRLKYNSWIEKLYSNDNLN